MDLSVIIVSYNVSSYLDQALATVADAVDGLDVEVFVVDNASTDDSVAMVRRSYPDVTLIENSENTGFARANNVALARSKGRYVLLLNPDTVLRKDTLRTMMSFLDDHPDAGAAGCKVLNPDGTLQLACRRGFPTPGVAFYKMVGLSALFPKSRTFGAYNLTYLDPDTVTEVDAVSGSFMMLRREALDRAGFLDEDYFMYGEDLDLCYRIKNAGWAVYYVPDTEIIHFKGESAKSVPSFKSIRDFYTAMHIFVEKHHTDRHRFLPAWLIIAAIYASMGLVSAIRMLRSAARPLLDLLLINVSLVLGIVLRFGLHLENAPDYTRLEWISIFVVYSSLYMGTFFFNGLYHRYRYSPERATAAVSLGFLLNVLMVYSIRQYNFSRIASFYSWGLNILLITGWRFAYRLIRGNRREASLLRAVVVGRLEDAAALKTRFTGIDRYPYDIVGCVEVAPDAIRGREVDGVHVLGLVADLPAVIREYGAETVIMVGSTVPFSRILNVGSSIGSLRPSFKLVPELKCGAGVQDMKESDISVIDISPNGVV